MNILGSIIQLSGTKKQDRDLKPNQFLMIRTDHRISVLEAGVTKSKLVIPAFFL